MHNHDAPGMRASEGKTLSRRVQTRLTNWVALCVAIHLVADFFFMTEPYLEVSHPMGLVASQCGLLTLWCVKSETYRVLRFAIAALTPIACWNFLSWVIAWDRGHDIAIAWAFAFLLQVVTIAILVAGQRWIKSRNSEKRIFQLQLETMLLWIGGFAIWFGFVRLGHTKWDWTLDFLSADLAKMMITLGALLGLTTVWAHWIYEGISVQNIVCRSIGLLAPIIVGNVVAFGVWPAYFGEGWSNLIAVVSIHSVATVCSLAMVFGLQTRTA